MVGNTLYIATSGKVNAAATGIEEGSKGSILTLNLETKELKTLSADLGYLDGIELTREGQLMVSVKGVQALYWINLTTGALMGALLVKVLLEPLLTSPILDTMLFLIQCMFLIQIFTMFR